MIIIDYCHLDETKPPEVVYEKLKDINGKGENFLLNVGPDGNWIVPERSAKILLEVDEMIRNEAN